eukprot:TRINITY_DN4098_c0_g1_i1.p1 TRINITY_DN4098_c0_g1~~TRINITY_DN4098_c0_g1_i1.p1  ORF type:complete len:193 (-),score=22.67 TRINITY_DN4098_c0_g1_i1:74-652(-)
MNDGELDFTDEPVVDVEAQAAPVSRWHNKHPIAVFFHLFWKAAALVTYLFLNYIIDSFVLSFIIVVLILAADFWTTKNVTGRLMVGLRYWHYVQEDGSNVWKFESSKREINKVEAVFFWTALVLIIPIWVLFGVIAVFNFEWEWLFVVIVAVVLSLANIVGYGRCLKDKKSKIKEMATGYITKQVVNQMTGQ